MKLRFLWKQTQQIAGLIYAAIRYNDKFPDKDTYVGSVEYSLPFSGKWVVANGGVDAETSHSWDIYPQRYAYDFLILDDEVSSYSGDDKNLNSYYCYGKDVLAPADGIVVAVYDSFSHCRIMGGGQTDPSSSDIGGNRITNGQTHVQHQIMRILMIAILLVDWRWRIKPNHKTESIVLLHSQTNIRKHLTTPLGAGLR